MKKLLFSLLIVAAFGSAVAQDQPAATPASNAKVKFENIAIILEMLLKARLPAMISNSPTRAPIR